MVELTLALPLLVLLLVGIVNAGDALYTYSSVVAATRDGARLGVRNTDPSAIKSLVLTNVAPLRDPTTVADITVTTTTVSNKNAIKVKACHNYKLLVAYPLLPMPNPIRMCPSTTMRVFS